MSHFYMSSYGTRGNGPTVTGTKSSGIGAHVRGWSRGVSVRGHHTVSGEDEFHVYATGGSNGGDPERLVGTLLADGRWVPNA
jgi:hypothetical protein